MADRFSAKKRSEIMSRVRGTETAPELAVRRLLHRAGYRFRLHRRELPGRPDIVLQRFKTAIFVHGCFWHGHPRCKRARLPTSNVRFWREKIGKNKERDRRCLKELSAMGYKAIVVWQCELKNPEKVLASLTAILK